MQHLVEPADTFFSQPALDRLVAYRAAVAAGFYTDWDGTASETDVHELAWLRPADDAGEGGGYPFTAEERERLERLRARLASESATSKNSHTDE